MKLAEVVYMKSEHRSLFYSEFVLHGIPYLLERNLNAWSIANTLMTFLGYERKYMAQM